VYLTTEDGMLRALSTADGTERWHAPGFIPDGTIAVADGRVVAPADDGIAAVRATDGSEVWRATVSPATRLSIGHGRVYAGGNDARTVTRLDLATGQALSPLMVEGADVASPMVSGDAVYVAHRDVPGGANGVDAFGEDGTPHWSWEPPGRERIEGTALGETLVFVLTEEPAVIYAISRADGSDIWKLQYDGHSSGAIVLADDLLLVTGEQAGLLALDASTGAQRWQAAVDNARPSRLLVTGGLVLLDANHGASDGALVAFVAPGDPRAPAAQAPPTPAALATPSAQPMPSGIASVDIRTVEPQAALLGIARGPDGTLYQPDVANHRILVRAPDGTTTWWGERGRGDSQFDFSTVTQNDAPGGVAISPDGQLIAVGEGGNHRIQLFDANRGHITTFGRTGRADGQFVNPCCVAIDDQHRVWVVDAGRGDVQVFDERGKHLDTFAGGGTGDGELSRPGTPFVRTETGEVYIPDFGNRRVSVFGTDGAFVRTFASRPEQDLILDEVNEVRVDQWGRMWVLDSINGIHVLSPDGDRLATIPTSLPGIGPLDLGGMALDGAGRLYLNDVHSDRLIVLQLGPPLWPGQEPTASP
jgi:outer membrane protein assembly factor BamB